MAKLIFTDAEVEAYLKTVPVMPVYQNNQYAVPLENLERRSFDVLHPYYLDALNTAEKMKVHADGFFPYALIRERRPNETLEVLHYRERIWVAKTKPTFSKVLNSLQKIRRSSDWVIKYDEAWDSNFNKIRPEETLEEYCEHNFPYFTSVTNWAFSFLLRKYLIDPNAVCFVYPDTTDIPETDFLQPSPTIFDSLNVLDFVDEDYAVLLNPYGATFYDGRGKQRVGKCLYIVTTQQILKYEQIDLKMNFNLTAYDHNLGELPAFKLGGTLIDQTDNYFLYESRIAGMIPELDEAVREYSDLQAAKVLHIYPERWEYTNTECTTCRGTGRCPNPAGGDDFICDRCEGSGYINAGPYSKMIITPQKNTDGTGAIPSPPAGFIEKDVEIVKLQEEGVKQHLADALAAINFEFLINVPLSQSGVSKQYDRNESNNTSHAVAEDIVSIMDKVYRYINKYRYGALYPDPEDQEAMVPTIPVPENYDLYSISDSQDELNKAKVGQTNPVILNALETDFASKRFNADTAVRDRLVLILQLDPLPNITEDEKMSRLSNKGITQESYVISSNIQEFVQRALEEDTAFADKQLKEQKAKMTEYAQVIIKAQATALAKVIPIGNPANAGLNPDGTPANGGNVPNPAAPPNATAPGPSPNLPANQNIPPGSVKSGN